MNNQVAQLIGESLPERKDGRLAPVEESVGQLVATHLSADLQNDIGLEDHLQRLGVHLRLVRKQLEIVEVQRGAEALEVMLLIHSHIHVLGPESAMGMT